MRRRAQNLGLVLLITSAFAVCACLVGSFAVASPAARTQAAQSSTQSAKTQTPSDTAKPKASSEKGEELVWVNTSSGVYHKKRSRWYGKTKKGKYMLEADAIKAGYKPAAKEH